MDYSDLIRLAPLVVLLIALVVLRKVETEMKPIVTGIVKGLTLDATSNAKVYAYGVLLSVTASLQALGDEATKMQWVYLVIFCKVAQPACVAVIGFISQLKGKPASSETKPPFASP